MCPPKAPKPQKLPPPRALARAPQDVKPTRTGTGQRQTVVNPDGMIKTAPTTVLGGSGVVLGA